MSSAYSVPSTVIFLAPTRTRSQSRKVLRWSLPEPQYFMRAFVRSSSSRLPAQNSIESSPGPQKYSLPLPSRRP